MCMCVRRVQAYKYCTFRKDLLFFSPDVREPWFSSLCGDVFHRGTFDGVDGASAVPWLIPGSAAVFVTGVPREEVGHSFWPQVCDAVLAVSGQYDWVGEHCALIVDPALEVAEEVLSARYVVREVRECLHDSGPRGALGGPSRVRVPLDEALDEGLDEDLLTVLAGPDLGDAHDDRFVQHVLSVERAHDLQGAAHRLDVVAEEGLAQRRPGFEVLGHARLAPPPPLRIRALAAQPERALCKRLWVSILIESSLPMVRGDVHDKKASVYVPAYDMHIYAPSRG